MKSIKEIEVRYSETDQMGVVYHSNYLVWMEVGRTNFLKDIGFDMLSIERDGFLFPVYSMEIKFLSPARYGERIRVETEVQSFSKIKTVYKQTILNDRDEIKVNALVTIVCVDKENFEPVRIDLKLKRLYEIYFLM